MRSAIGNALLTNLVIIFASIIILFFVGILAYSKAYKVKNRIINYIESKESYNTNDVEELNEDLKSAGYQLTSKSKCSSDNLNKTTYNYCVYRVELKDKKYYYKVVTYVHFEFPVIGSIINVPVKGETKILGKTYDY